MIKKSECRKKKTPLKKGGRNRQVVVFAEKERNFPSRPFPFGQEMKEMEERTFCVENDSFALLFSLDNLTEVGVVKIVEEVRERFSTSCTEGPP